MAWASGSARPAGRVAVTPGVERLGRRSTLPGSWHGGGACWAGQGRHLPHPASSPLHLFPLSRLRLVGDGSGEVDGGDEGAEEVEGVVGAEDDCGFGCA